MMVTIRTISALLLGVALLAGQCSAMDSRVRPVNFLEQGQNCAEGKCHHKKRTTTTTEEPTTTTTTVATTTTTTTTGAIDPAEGQKSMGKHLLLTFHNSGMYPVNVDGYLKMHRIADVNNWKAFAMDSRVTIYEKPESTEESRWRIVNTAGEWWTTPKVKPEADNGHYLYLKAPNAIDMEKDLLDFKITYSFSNAGDHYGQKQISIFANVDGGMKAVMARGHNQAIHLDTFDAETQEGDVAKKFLLGKFVEEYEDIIGHMDTLLINSKLNDGYFSWGPSPGQKYAANVIGFDTATKFSDFYLMLMDFPSRRDAENANKEDKFYVKNDKKGFGDGYIRTVAGFTPWGHQTGTVYDIVSGSAEMQLKAGSYMDGYWKIQGQWDDDAYLQNDFSEEGDPKYVAYCHGSFNEMGDKDFFGLARFYTNPAPVLNLDKQWG